MAEIFEVTDKNIYDYGVNTNEKKICDVQHGYYEKHHSTVKDASELAEKLGIKNLLLYHTEDRNLANRKAMYTEEGKAYYHGKLWIPEDLEMIEI